MPIIELITRVNSGIAICFDLSRSIDLHIISTGKTNEKAVAGRTSGLIEFNETVTWQATHFGIRQYLSSKITAFERPYFFVDEQVKGPFKYIYHEHQFREDGNQVIITDVFKYKAPFGLLGSFFDKAILNKYMKNLISDRNSIIREYAESNKWKEILIE